MTVTYLGGILPRSERYMKSHWDHAKGFVDAGGLEAARRQEEADHIALQQEAGLALLAPALVAWEDLFRPLTWPGGGCVAGQLTRTFETNTFHRQPELAGLLPPADPLAWFRCFQVPSGKPWVLTLPSPWDFALRAREQTPSSRRERAGECAHVLNAVVRAARKRGAEVVRFHDPSILHPRAPARDVEVFAEALGAAAKGHAEACTLHLTNGDPFAHPEVLEANPLGGLSIEDPGTKAPRLRLANGLRLSAAVVHGEESLVEEPRALAAQAADLASRLGVPLWGITNGWDLDHVPHAIGVRKAQALARAGTALKEVVA